METLTHDTTPQPESILAGEHQYNDTYNANALIEQHGNQIRYVKGWGWLAWDGKRWERDADDRVIQFAKTTIQQMMFQAAKLTDRNAQWELMKHIRRSLDYPRLTAMVKLAQSDQRIRMRPEDFDKHPMRFNAQNGTIDLYTGELLPHDPNDFITQLDGCAYDPEERSELWEGLVLWASGGLEDLRDYLQRALGYSLTGKTGEKVFFFCYGAEGNNGKSTLLEAVKYFMGDYGLAVATETVLSKGGVGGSQTRDNRALEGKR